MKFCDRVLLLEENRIITYRKGCLYKRTSVTGKPELILSLYNELKYKLLTRCSITERLLRLEPRFAIPCNSSEFYLSFNGKMLLIDERKGKIIAAHSYREKMKNPLNAAMVRDLSGFDDGLYYGEYWGNTEHSEVSIYRIKDNTSTKVFTFKPETILHIHALIADYENHRMLILSGDNDKEANIWEAKDNFQIVKKICGGKQTFRSCCAYSTSKGIYYATDTPLENNYIFFYDEKNKKEQVYKEISGPCIYSTTFKNSSGETRYAFSTSVEPDSQYVGTWKYRLSRKPGPGIKDKYSHVYITDFGDVFYEIGPYKKDWLPYQLFQFGNIRFPYQMNSRYFAICPQSIAKLHGTTVMIGMEEIR